MASQICIRVEYFTADTRLTGNPHQVNYASFNPLRMGFVRVVCKLRSRSVRAGSMRHTSQREWRRETQLLAHVRVRVRVHPWVWSGLSNVLIKTWDRFVRN